MLLIFVRSARPETVGEVTSHLLTEAGGLLLQENGGGILLDEGTPPIVIFPREPPVLIAYRALPTGHLHIGRFVNAEPEYTINNEIIEYQHVEESHLRPNVVVVDGEDDSWTEYNRQDLTERDTTVNMYLDLPNLTNLGDVRQRAVEEMEAGGQSSSPGGRVVWDTRYSVMDKVNWIARDGSKYETRIEGLAVEFNQSTTPFQRATIDTGLMVLCPPDEEATYLVRDMFDREGTGLGDADEGGTWVTT